MLFRKKLVFSVVLLVVAVGAFAQKPYKNGIGIVLGATDGVTFKTFLNNNLAFQTDFGSKVSIDRIKYYDNGKYKVYSNQTYWMLLINPSLMYEESFAHVSGASFYWFAGGGVNLGYRFGDDDYRHVYPYHKGSGQFGINGIGGCEVAFRAVPLALQLDMRPGYGMQFTSKWNRSLFDWSLNLSLRFCFG